LAHAPRLRTEYASLSSTGSAVT